MWKIAIAFIAGVASAIALVAAFLWFEVQGFQDLIVVPESERVDASFTVRVPHPVDVMEFASMDSREILERFQFLGETDRAALKTLFDSNSHESRIRVQRRRQTSQPGLLHQERSGRKRLLHIFVSNFCRCDLQGVR